MVMLNGKTYAPSSYVGSPRFTRMEKTARTTFSDGEKYPTTKEVRLLLTLRLVSVVVTGYRSSTPPCLGQRTPRRTSGTSSRRGCWSTTLFTTGALWLSTKTNWIVVRTTCLSTTPPCQEHGIFRTFSLLFFTTSYVVLPLHILFSQFHSSRKDKHACY